MAMARKQWVYSPSYKGLKVPERLKAEVTARANDLVETVLKPGHIEPPPAEPQFNYLVDIRTRWRGRFFTFCALYNCPQPEAPSPCLEFPFTRLGYVGNDRLDMAYMRHTGRWQEVFQGLTLDERLESIRRDPWLRP